MNPKKTLSKEDETKMLQCVKGYFPILQNFQAVKVRKRKESKRNSAESLRLTTYALLTGARCFYLSHSICFHTSHAYPASLSSSSLSLDPRIQDIFSCLEWKRRGHTHY